MSKDETIEALTAERDDAVRGMTSALRLVCDLRWALGDRGARMQPELVEFAHQMRKDAERYRWLREGGNYVVRCEKAQFYCGGHVAQSGTKNYPQAFDAAVDAAMALHNHQITGAKRPVD